MLKTKRIVLTLVMVILTFSVYTNSSFAEGDTYTVSFESQGGSVVDSIEAENNSLIDPPDDPILSGYYFAGWYGESGCDNAWDFDSDVVTEDITLYADWALEDANGDGYHDNDFNRLQAFLNQPSAEAGKTNGQQLNAGYDPDDPDTWAGLTWWDSTPKRIEYIDWVDKSLSGPLDVSRCSALTMLTCDNNQIGSLNLHGCIDLYFLGCIDTQLSTLDLSDNTALIFVYCGSNQLTALDVSNNVNLNILKFQNNQISEIDLNQNTELDTLDCSGNLFTTITIEDHPLFYTLNCLGNPLTYVCAEFSDGTEILLQSNGNGYVGVFRPEYDHDYHVQAVPQDHYEFVNWTASGTPVSTDERYDLSFESSYDLVANFEELIGYDLVAFDSMGGSEVDSVYVEHNTLLASPEEPEKTGYTFAGWYRESECANAWDFENDLVTGDITLYAKWTINVYAVTFDSQGGSAVDSIEAENNSLIDPPDDPVLSGYYFAGWYTEADCTNIWDFEADVVTENITLYAEWLLDDINEDGYNDNDFDKLQAFLNQPSAEAGKTNGQQINANYDPDDPNTWAGVVWDSSDPKRVEEIGTGAWNSKSLSGDLDLSGFTSLTAVYCRGNSIISLNLRGDSSLETVDCGFNQIAGIDVRNDYELTTLSCDNNQISTLNISDNAKLIELSCRNNQITDLDVGANTALLRLDCSVNPLATLDISNCAVLYQLDCIENQLTELDLSGNPALQYLFCGSNQLTALDISANTHLNIVKCQDNQLSELDISQNAELDTLYCSDNQFASLTIEDHPLFCALVCLDNPLTYVHAEFFDGSSVQLQSNGIGYVGLHKPESDNQYIEAAPQQYNLFVNWTSSGTPVYSDATYDITPGSSYDLVANFELLEGYHSVAFDSIGGSTVGSFAVAYGSLIEAPDPPTRTSYTFSGWYKESECVNAWNFDTDTVTENITLYAKWTLVSYGNAFEDLGFTPLDMVLDPERPVAYLTAEDGYCLYRVDLETGDIAEKVFDKYAECLTIGDGKLYITLNTETYEGNAVAVVETASFDVDRIFEIALRPNDIEYTGSGIVFIEARDPDDNYLSSYNVNNGTHISDSTLGCSYGYIAFNSELNKIYAVSRSQSPADLYANQIADGYVTDKYDSPYHGDYNMYPYIRISPDGQYIFNSIGYMFTCAPDEADDMIYDGYLGFNNNFTSICFDLPNNLFYTTYNKTLKAFYYDSRTIAYTQTSQDEYIQIAYDGSKIITLQQNGEGTYYIATVDANQDADLIAIDVDAGELLPVFESGIHDYCLILDADSPSVTITPVLSDPEGKLSINGDETPSKTIVLDNGASAAVVIGTESADGMAQKTYTVRVYRETAEDFIVHNEFFEPYEQEMAPDGIVYMTGKKQSFVYKVDTVHGTVDALPMPGIARYLNYADTELYISLDVPTFDQHYIGVIDPDTFTLSDIFEVNDSVYGIKSDTGYIYTYTNENATSMPDTYVYSRGTHEVVSSADLATEIRDLDINPVTGRLYFTKGGYVRSRNVIDGVIQPGEVSSEYGHGGHFSFTPDGAHLVLYDGDVVTCSANPDEDLLDAGKVDTDGANAIIESSNELFTVYDRNIYVYDSTDLSYEYALPLSYWIDSLMERPGYIMPTYNLMHRDGYMIVTYDDGINTRVHSLHSGALLKNLLINGEPFSEFYPLQMDMDRGEVPNALATIDIEATPLSGYATISGDIGTQPLSVGENVLSITVTDTLTGESETYHLTFTRRETDWPVDEHDARLNLGFIPFDVVLDPDRPVAYMTGEDRYSVYRVNYETGEITEKQFDLKAERLAISNGKVYVTLLRQEHVYSMSDGYGAIAVIDTASFKTETIFNIAIDPYDIEADEQGFVFVSPGSGQGEHLSSYDSSNARHISDSSHLYRGSVIDYNPIRSRIYAVELLNPNSMESFTFTDGVYTAHASWPYHGEYDLAPNIWISPDGQYIFNGLGNIFACYIEQEGVMVYSGTINPFTSVCFDLPNDMFYTSQDDTITAYQYESRNEAFSYTSPYAFFGIYHTGNDIVAVQKRGNKYYINHIDPSVGNTALSTIYTSTGMLTPLFDQDTLEYTLTLDEDTAGSTITPVVFDDSCSLKIDGQSVASKTVSVETGGTVDVSIEVTGPDMSSRVYTVHVVRDPSSDAYLSDLEISAGSLSPLFSSAKYNYTLTLAASEQSIEITPVKSCGYSTMTIDGILAVNKTIELEAGESTDVAIVVTAQDGTTQKTYSIHTERQLPDLYTVEYNSQGGTAVDSIMVEYGSLIQAPDEPTRTSYAFSGWYKEAECVNAWDFDTDTVTANTTLYAKWINSIIGSSIYSIDESNGILYEISLGTSVEQLKSKLINPAEYIKVYDKHGIEYTGGAVATGMTVKLIIEGDVKDELTLAVLGDVSGDGEININDILFIRANILDKYTLNAYEFISADIDKDQGIDVVDILYVRAHILDTYTIIAR